MTNRTTPEAPRRNASYRSPSTGRWYWIDAKGIATLDLGDQYDEGPTCSICDGLGHGYPGGGPCPLEERGYDEAREDERREAHL